MRTTLRLPGRQPLWRKHERRTRKDQKPYEAHEQSLSNPSCHFLPIRR
jgi:hypothetical protein